jgi:hypothetical protein
LKTRSIADKLNYRGRKVIQVAEKYIEEHRGRLEIIPSAILYRVLGTIHLALVTDAGLIIAICTPILFGDQFRSKLSLLSLAFLISYVLCDLIRLRFMQGATISLGFPLVFLTLLTDSPFAALFNATFGSLISEALRSIWGSKQRRAWFPALWRAFFYAGHHAVASLGALFIYLFVSNRFPPWLLETVHLQAIAAYVAAYSLISMLLIWPHDRRIHLFLALDEAPFVRIDLFTAPLLLPLPGVIFCLYSLSLGQIEKIFTMVGGLPPVFVLLFYLARSYTKTEEDRERLELREELGERLGSPANMAEMVERLLTIMGQLVNHRWGAVYSLGDQGQLELCGAKPAKGPIVVRSPDKTEDLWWPSQEAGKAKGQVAWPTQVKPGEGFLDKMARAHLPPRFFDRSQEPVTPSDPYLPPKTALAVYPIQAKTQEVIKPSFRLIGMIALARPRRMFTTWDWEMGQALSQRTGNTLLGVQRHDRTLRELYQKVEDFAKDPEKVRQAVQELFYQQVDVSKILAVVSEHSFQDNLRAVLQNVVDGKRGNGVSLDTETLTDIYNQVRDETPGMAPLNPRCLQLLQRVTSSLSLAFSFRYQFPDVERGPAFREFYEFLLVALDANTVSRIVALDTQIKSTTKAIQGREKTIRRASESRAVASGVLPLEVFQEIEKLQEIVDLLKKSEAKDFIAQKAALGQAIDWLMERERAVREKLRDPERFAFLRILFGWRAAVTNALEEVGHGPARLTVSLRSQQALPLEEIIVGLVLQNDGQGVASGLVVELKQTAGYEVIKDHVDLGTLIPGKVVEPEFTLRPTAEDPLRLQFRITYHDWERKSKVEEFADLLHLRERPGGFIEIPNPYTPGIPLRRGDPTFVGREDIFVLIRQNILALVGKKTLVLVGERRTGKTSILKQLPSRLNTSHTIPIYVDCQGLGIDPGLENFFLGLAEAIADGLEGVGISVQRLSPEDLGESPQYVFERHFLPMLRERIGDRTLLLTIDEFEELGERVRRGRLPYEVFRYLRHLIQHGEQLAFIFIGTHKIEELMGDYWSELFNIAEYKKISFLNREETIRLLTEPVRPYGMIYDDLAINEVLRLTACHPYFTQLLCSILVNRCNEAQRNYVTVQNVRDAVAELLETGRAHLTFLWQTSDREAKLILAALVELRDRLDQVSIAAIAEQLRSYQIQIDNSRIIKAMEQMIARDIVCEIQGSPVSYDFTAQLYAHWLRRYKPLGKVAEETDEFTIA